MIGEGGGEGKEIREVGGRGDVKKEEEEEERCEEGGGGEM